MDKNLVEIKELEEQLSIMSNPYPGVRTDQLKYLPQYASNQMFRITVDRWIENKDRLDVLLAENSMISDRLYSMSAISLEFNSGVVAMSDTGAIIPEHKTDISILTDIVGDDIKHVTPDMSQIKFINTSYDLNKFFERPIQVGSFAIAAGGTYENAYRICDLYLNDPTVRSKLRNFSFLRARFCVRIAVSGTQFNYGRVMCAAYPWSEDIAALNQLFTIGATWDKLKLQYMSQTKYSSVIDLKENKPLEFELPWVGTMHAGRLYNKSASALGTATSYTDFRDMWTVYIKTLNPMASTQTGSTANFCYVYVYLKDVELGIPTASQTAVTTNSGVEDERKTGPVEKMSSAMLAVSQKLEMVPYIGTYAKASSFVLGGIKGIASLFGWSAPVLDVIPNRVKNEPYQNGTLMVQYDTSKRLVLDPKQELSISSEYLAIDKDELSIANMCNISSYLNTFSWQATTSSLSPLIFMYVHPRLCSPFVGSPSGTVNVVPTPMEFATTPFTKWHGDIEFTFEIVCSSFHKGKLLIVYEPNIYAYAGVLSNQSINKQFSHVVDIQETQKFTIRVAWNQARQWLNNLTTADAFYSYGTGFTGINNAVADAVNGFVYVLPLTKLQSPDSSNVSVNVYVRGVDMKVNRFDSKFMPTNRTLQYNSNCCNVEDTTVVINESALSSSGMYDNFYGEAPVSFRALLKRFVSQAAIGAPSYSAAPTRYRFLSELYSDHFAPGTSITIKTLFGYLRYSFLAMRGSMRKRISLHTSNALHETPLVVQLFEDSSGQPSPASVTTSANSITGMQLAGSVMYVPNTNAGVEFEIPFYNNNLFCFASSSTEFAPNCPMYDASYNTTTYAVNVTPGTTQSYFSFQESEATGEDFQFAYFIGSTPYRT